MASVLSTLLPVVSLPSHASTSLQFGVILPLTSTPFCAVHCTCLCLSCFPLLLHRFKPESSYTNTEIWWIKCAE